MIVSTLLQQAYLLEKLRREEARDEASKIETPVLDLLMHKRHWTRGCLARDTKGRRLPSERVREGFSFCMLGAIKWAYGCGTDAIRARQKILNAIHKLYGHHHKSIQSFNDFASHEEVVTVLKWARV